MTPAQIKSEMPGLYNSWRGMRDRCRSVRRADAHCYALKGITADKRFDSVVDFADWALSNGYRPGLTLDRRDGDKGYSPENCRWVDRLAQGRNLSKNHRIEFDGRTLCLSEWAEVTGIRAANILARITRLGWTVERALTTPNQPLFGGRR